MSFSDVMQNLAIGIAGGIFSSIIVSVVFYVLNDYQNELDKAKDMTYPLYHIHVVNSMGSVSDDSKLIKSARKCFKSAVNNFSKFEAWRFKYELNDAMCKINEIIRDGKYYNKNNELSRKQMINFYKEIEKQLDIIDNCEKNFAKGFIKRLFTNKIIIASGVMFIAITFIA